MSFSVFPKMDDQEWKTLFINSIRRGEGKSFIDLYLIAESNINASRCNGDTILSYAVEDGDLEIVEYLVQKGANPSIQNVWNGFNPWHIASVHGYDHILEFFYNLSGDKQFNIDVQTWQGETPLVLAAASGERDVVEFLLRSGANVHLVDDCGFTALHHASSNGWLGIVQDLVTENCDLDVQDYSGVTPILVAAESQDQKVVELLINSGADITICDFTGWSVLHYACYCKEWVDIVKVLIRNGANINAQTACGTTPLHAASVRKCTKLIEILLEAGADWNVRNGSDLSPLKISVRISPCLEAIQLFLRYGAYFETSDYLDIFANPELKKVEVCAQGIMNEFNYKDLPAFYELPGCAERLPRIENLKIVHDQNVAREIEKSVENNILNHFKEACPPILKMLSVKSLINYYKTK